MRASTIFLALSRFLLPPAIIATLLLYLYPAAQQCEFPTIPPSQSDSVQETQCFFNSSSSSSSGSGQKEGGTTTTLGRIRREKAPFRLLALGDPQLEGDSSFAKYRRGSGSTTDSDGLFPSLDSLRTRFASTMSNDTNTTFSDLGPLVTESLTGFLNQDVPRLLATWRKKLDLLGNDYYLAHIFRLVRWWTQPTHVVVLGDLLGSQWIGDEEFERRADRFWKRVFKGVDKVEEEIMSVGDVRVEGEEGGTGKEAVDVVGSPEWKEWENRLINVAGNHDIGYAGDINARRIARFERRFGLVNWRVKFRLPSSHNDTAISKTPNNQSNLFFSQSQPQEPPELELVILNDMNLDLPALSLDLHNQSWSFLNNIIDSKKQQQQQQQHSNNSTTTTILLTHIPLHKNAGVCVDAPFFSYFPENNGGGIREQNHLSESSSQRILNGLFSHDNGDSGGGGIILNGHDHEGCDVWHYKENNNDLTLEGEEEEGQEDEQGEEEDGDKDKDKITEAEEHKPQPQWTATRFSPSFPPSSFSQQNQGIREITVRSMMGSYSGTAGLLSGYFDPNTSSWKFEYSTCVLGVQHFWWAVHVLDCIVVGLGVLGVVCGVCERGVEEEGRKEEGGKDGRKDGRKERGMVEDKGEKERDMGKRKK